MEKAYEVRTEQTDYICDKCKWGQMRPTGTVLTSNPPVFPHECNNPNCKEMMSFNHTYPYLEYKPIQN